MDQGRSYLNSFVPIAEETGAIISLTWWDTPPWTDDESPFPPLIDEQGKLIRPILQTQMEERLRPWGTRSSWSFPARWRPYSCAAEIQERLGDRNWTVPERRRLQVRVGITWGTSSMAQGTSMASGDVASRIEPLAKAGGCASRSRCTPASGTRTALEFDVMGRVELKNVQIPHERLQDGLARERDGAGRTAGAMRGWQYCLREHQP